MICHDRRCIFVHVPKTAGESVETLFLGRPMNRDGKALPEKHASAAEIRARYPEEFARYYKFGIVRNPWDRFVSHVHYRRRRRRIDAPVEKLIPRLLTLENFHHKSAMKMLFVDGELAVDHVVRFERLEEDLKEVWKALDMGDVSLPKTNASAGRRPYSDYFDYYTKEFIARTQADEIDFFGYRFDGEVPEPSLPGRLLADARIAVRRRLHGL